MAANRLVHRLGVEQVEPQMARAHDLVGDRRAQEAEGRADAGADRHHDLLHAELARQPRGMQRRGAAEGDQRALGGVLAVLDGMHAGGTRHGLVDDLGDAGRRALGVGLERTGRATAAPPRPCRGWSGMAPPAKRVGIEAAERGVGIGHGGLGAAAAVAGGAGHAAGRNRGRPGCGPAHRCGRSSRRRRRSRPARSRECAPAGRCPARSDRRARPRTGASAAARDRRAG